MKRLTPRLLATVALASTLGLGACSSAEESEPEPTTSTTVTSSPEETTTEATESEDPAAEESAAEETGTTAAPQGSRSTAPTTQASSSAPAPAPQQGQPEQEQEQQAAPQQDGPASREAVINGLTAAGQASGEDVNSIPPEILNGLYGCLADSLISQGANELTHNIANVDDTTMTPQQSQQMQVASETCYGQLMNQFG